MGKSPVATCTRCGAKHADLAETGLCPECQKKYGTK